MKWNRRYNQHHRYAQHQNWPVTSRVPQSRALWPKTTCCCSHTPGSTLATTAECSRQCWHTWSLSIPRNLQQGAVCAAPAVRAKWERVFLNGLQVVGENHHSYHWLQRWAWGSLNSHHLWLQSPQRRALQLNTTSPGSLSPGNSHTLLLTLPNTWAPLNMPKAPHHFQGLKLGVPWAYILQILAAVKSPATRHWLLPYPVPPYPWKYTQHPGDNSPAHSEERQQISKLPCQK